MKNVFIPIALLCFSNCFILPVFAQQAPTSGKVYSKILPDDLPNSKLLFIKFRPAPIPAERPTNMSPANYKLLQQHAINYPRANEQLEAAVAHYPFAYRITTQDSTSYYYAHGYKYVLFHQSFGAFTNGYFKGSDGTNETYVDLYIQDLSSRDKYLIDSFNEKSIYYYKGLVGMLLKLVDKQIKVKKTSQGWHFGHLTADSLLPFQP